MPTHFNAAEIDQYYLMNPSIPMLPSPSASASLYSCHNLEEIPANEFDEFTDASASLQTYAVRP
jgi:hypothetical protein